MPRPKPDAPTPPVISFRLNREAYARLQAMVKDNETISLLAKRIVEDMVKVKAQ